MDAKPRTIRDLTVRRPTSTNRTAQKTGRDVSVRTDAAIARTERSALRLLVTAKLEVLAALEGELMLVLARRALEPQDDLLRRLRLYARVSPASRRRGAHALLWKTGLV